MERTFPFTGWRLMPSFKTVQIEIVRQYNDWHPEWLCNAAGRIFGASEIFDSKEAAIAAGRSRLEAMSEKYRAMGVSIHKKTQALDSAEKES